MTARGVVVDLSLLRDLSDLTGSSVVCGRFNDSWMRAVQVPAVREVSPELAQLCERVVAAIDPAAAAAESAKPPLPPPAETKAAEAPDAATKPKVQVRDIIFTLLYIQSHTHLEPFCM